VALFQPEREPAGRLGDRVDRGYAYDGKALGERAGDDRLLEAFGLQKSRSS
jgi:hypothetical protein